MDNHFFLNKIVLCLGKLGKVCLKATVGKRVTTLQSLYSHSILLLVKNSKESLQIYRLEMSEEDKNLPYLYWTSKLHIVLSNIVLLLAPVNVPQKICHACSPKS